MAHSTGEQLPAYERNMARAFAVYDGNMRKAPPPERVAKVICRAIEDGTSSGFATHAVGEPFQALIAPFLTRFGSTALVRWCTCQYFKLRRDPPAPDRAS